MQDQALVLGEARVALGKILHDRGGTIDVPGILANPSGDKTTGHAEEFVE